MKTRRYRVYLVLSLLIAFGGLGTVLVTDTSPQLGLDLSGGTSVTLTAISSEDISPAVLDKTVEIIRERVDAIGTIEPEISRSGENNIVVQLPGVKNEKRALELIGTTAQLTFRQVESIIPADLPTPTPSAEDEAKGDKGDKGKQGKKGKQDEPDEPEPTPPPGETPEVTEQVDSTVNDQEVVYPGADDPENLYVLKPAVLTGDVVDRAEAVPDPTSGQWSVTIDMDREGSERWAEFTSELACLRDEGEQIKSQVAIVLDGKVQSAAGMRSPQEAGAGGGVACGTGITGGQTQIDIGDQQEAKNLALVLKTGALPLTLEQSELQKVSPTLGRDSLRSGIIAGLLGLGLVMIYVLLYYRALGLVVWAGLAVFAAALYTLTAILGETAGFSLNLAGIAGFIVSVGVTADSYIVAFERLKDEARSGKSVRAAVDRGMSRAFKTILVADFVTGSAAIILFMLAVGSVRGFALTLGLATMIDVLIAYFFTRSAVNLLARTRRFAEGKFIGLRSAMGQTS